MSELTQSSHQLDDAAVIQQVVQRLEDGMRDTLRHFNEARSSLLWRVNTLQASTRKFPTEILCHIFLLASEHRESYYGHRTIIKLGFGQVCSLWRQITLSTPQLWSSLTLSFNGKLTREMQNVLNLLQLHLDRAEETPFSLEFHFGDYDHYSRPDMSTLSVLSQSLSSSLSEEGIRKVHVLKFVNAPVEWLSSLPKFPGVEELRISRAVHSFRQEVFLETLPIHSPRLCRLELHDFHVPLNVRQVHRLEITHVSLSRVQIIICISLLTNCPNLVRFESTYPLTDGALSMVIAGAGTTILHQLEYFSWAHPEGLTSFQDLDLMGFYRRLSCPALRTLRWWGNRTAQPNIDALQVLLPNLPSTLSSLNIRFVLEWPILLIERLFEQATNLQNLSFYGCDSITMNNSIIALDGWRENAKQQGAYLPHLKLMSFDGIGNLSPEAENTMANHITNTLHDRCQVLGMGFSLELSRREGSWTRVMWKAYRLLQEEGIDMKVWADWKKRRLLEEPAAADKIGGPSRGGGTQSRGRGAGRGGGRGGINFMAHY